MTTTPPSDTADTAAVLLPAHAVASLRNRLARCTDPTATPDERNEERIKLVGAVQFWLDGPADDQS